MGERWKEMERKAAGVIKPREANRKKNGHMATVRPLFSLCFRRCTGGLVSSPCLRRQLPWAPAQGL